MTVDEAVAKPVAFESWRPLAILGLGVCAALVAAAGQVTLAVAGGPVLVACLLGVLGDARSFLWIVIAVSGVGLYWAEGSFEIVGQTINLSGLQWGLVLLTGASLLFRWGATELPKSFRLYALFVLVAAAGIVRAPDWFEGLRHVLLFAAPLVLGSVAFHAMDGAETLRGTRRALWAALALALIGVVVVQLAGGFQAWGLGLSGTMGNRTFAIFLVPLFALAVASARYRSSRYLWLAAGLLGLGVATMSRTVLFTMLALSALATTRMRRGVRATVGVALIMFAAVALQVAPLRARFFEGGGLGGGRPGVAVVGTGEEAALAVGDLRLSGRGWLWLQVGRNALTAPWIGHGTGSSATYLRRTLEAELHHPHNDYLRVFHDFGAAGLLLFLAVGVAMVRSLLRLHRRARTAEGREYGLAAALSVVGFFLIALTDNVLLYATFFTQNVFVLVAMAERAANHTPDDAVPMVTHGA